MPALTRLCGRCAQRAVPAGQWTNPRTGRNTFYCATCAPVMLTVCAYCANTLSMGQAIPMRPWPAYAPPPHGTRSPNVVCSACYDLLMPGCGNCGLRMAPTEERPLQPPGTPRDCGRLCGPCEARSGPCPRCNSLRVGEWTTNGFSVLSSTCCARCRFLPLPDSTFMANRSQRRVGFELEFFNPRNISHLPALELLGNLHHDGSIAPGAHPAGFQTTGREFASRPSRGDKLWETVGEVMRLIRDEYGGGVNNTCGLHAHFDMAGYSNPEVRNAVRWWTEFEPLFMSLVPDHRRNNHYSLPLGWRSHNYLRERYGALNYHSFAEHGTLEVRLHHATLDADEFRLWLHIMLRFFDTFPKMELDEQKLSKLSMRGLTSLFMSETKMDWRTRKHMVKRARQYGWASAYQTTPAPRAAGPGIPNDTWVRATWQATITQDYNQMYQQAVNSILSEPIYYGINNNTNT